MKKLLFFMFCVFILTVPVNAAEITKIDVNENCTITIDKAVILLQKVLNKDYLTLIEMIENNADKQSVDVLSEIDKQKEGNIVYDILTQGIYTFDFCGSGRNRNDGSVFDMSAFTS